MIFLRDNSLIYNKNYRYDRDGLDDLLKLNKNIKNEEEYLRKIDNSKIIKELEDKKISDIIEENNNIIVFPFGRKVENIKGNSYIFSKRGNKKYTRNVAGFLSYSEVNYTEEIRIGSRFSKNENTQEDYFLNYMLKRVLNYNLASKNFSFSNRNGIFDLLIFLFPDHLEKALHQGIYKEYIVKEYSDMNVKGVIDINKFLKNNIPFTGQVSYKTREFSYDNDITQLIRHTIEVINKKDPKLLKVNKLVEESVRSIISATPTYNKSNRHKIIQKNSNNPLKNAYFSKYIDLQRLCIQILTNQKIEYSSKEESSKITGIIIDIAWLWEEYIACVTKATSQSNLETDKYWKRYIFKENHIDLFEAKDDYRYRRYPDFVYKNIPIDTKYKVDLDDHKNYSWDFSGRNDLNQIITYMYLLKSNAGGFIKPFGRYDSKNFEEEGLNVIGNLAGYGGEVFIYNFEIPDVNKYIEFVSKIKKVENALLEKIEERYKEGLLL